MSINYIGADVDCKMTEVAIADVEMAKVHVW